ncbi:P22 phage major capsid protein family protein [Zhengella sp. ZM62]|uniref:P22 phage major capsid protein family protein n=1 Tax=Zhengella sedimenti TaxID=3390035 RepID=UPI0039764627
MANVLTDLAADIYKAADIVGRELVGAIPSVTINAGSERAAFNDTVRAAFTRAATVNTSYSPAMTIPEGDDQTVDNKTMTINKVANVQIPWTGEDIRHVRNGAGFETVYGDQIAQAMRGITNAIEAETLTTIYKGSSRAFGTAGTTPFGSDFDAVAEIRQILVDNGMPIDGQTTLVLNTAAGTKLRNLANLQKANEAGGTELLRRGTLLDLQGIMLKESAQVQSHTKGTATGLDAAGGEPIGETTIALDGGDGGTLLSGDVVTFAGDTVNKYVVNTGFTAASGNAIIGGPGLRATLADTTEMTIGNSYTANVAFHRQAVELVVRPPDQPFGGDAAVDRMTVQDPVSGLVYEIAVYKGYGKAMIDVTTFYGVKVWKPDFVATLLG